MSRNSFPTSRLYPHAPLRNPTPIPFQTQEGATGKKRHCPGPTLAYSLNLLWSPFCFLFIINVYAESIKILGSPLYSLMSRPVTDEIFYAFSYSPVTIVTTTLRVYFSIFFGLFLWRETRKYLVLIPLKFNLQNLTRIQIPKLQRFHPLYFLYLLFKFSSFFNLKFITFRPVFIELMSVYFLKIFFSSSADFFSFL